MKTNLLPVLVMLITCAVHAQTKIDLSNISQFTVENRTIEPVVENGRQVLKLSEAPGDGLAILNNVTFESGTIEFDVKGRNVIQQSFVGIAFRVQDRTHFEAIYFRPFNFMNADTARRRRAVQYISMPDHPWEELREHHPGKYENRVAPVPDADSWFHVKVVVAAKEVTAYVNDAPSPSLSVIGLSDRQSGKVALWAGNSSNANFANLVITHKPTKTEK